MPPLALMAKMSPLALLAMSADLRWLKMSCITLHFRAVVTQQWCNSKTNFCFHWFCCQWGFKFLQPDASQRKDVLYWCFELKPWSSILAGRSLTFSPLDISPDLPVKVYITLVLFKILVSNWPAIIWSFTKYCAFSLLLRRSFI